MRSFLWRDGQVIMQESYTLIERLYFRNEILGMLDNAGFRDVQVLADYKEEPASADSGILIFVTQK